MSQFPFIYKFGFPRILPKPFLQPFNMKVKYLIGLLGVIGLVVGHEDHMMDHDYIDEQANDSAGVAPMDVATPNTENLNSNLPLPSLIPVPHVPKHHHGVPILNTSLLPEERLFWENFDTTTYFSVTSSHHLSLYVHIVLGFVAMYFVYPILLIFNNLNLRNLYFGGLAVHTTLMTISIVNYFIFINSIEDLYPGNAYHKMTWILLFTTTIHMVLTVFLGFYRKGEEYTLVENSSDYDQESLTESLYGYQNHASDSTNATSCESPSCSHTPEFDENQLKTSINAMLPTLTLKLQGRIERVMSIVFNLLNWGHLVYFLVYIPTGVATFLVLGKGNTVFNLLAHFIKGGVFFIYGMLSLARYSGAFTHKGWAWNHRFIISSQSSKYLPLGLFTMEFLESSLILFYGCTNIFLEHLSDAGGEWSPKDLQHASIAFIFIGCGLCGVITDIKLNSWRFEKSVENYEAQSKLHNSHKINKGSPGFSPNPFPVITIFWTGILMSKHQQDSPLSTEIHIQWGNLLILACAFRFITYFLQMTVKPSSKIALTQPTRPFTELVVSFGLLCGGLIFMESTDSVVLLFEYYGFTSMLTLNVSLGLITLFMSWEMLLFAFKDWLITKKENHSTY